MRRTIAFLSTIAIAVGILAVGAPAANADLSDDQFRLRAKTTHEHFEDSGRKGPSLGDTITFTSRLFLAGERVGRDAITCKVIKAQQSTFRLHCWGTLSLRDHGDLSIHGMVTFTEESTALPVLAVTGGTGEYAGASGTMTLEEKRATFYNISLMP